MEIIRKIIKERTFISKDNKTKSRYGDRGRNNIEWIIVHYTGDRCSKGCAGRMVEAMQTWKRSVSTHYLVGDDAIYQCVEDRHAAWHCAIPKDIVPKCGARNRNAIGVDLVEHKRIPKEKSVKCRDWYFTEKVVLDGAQLVAMLADKYDIPTDHIVRHFDVTGKWCPRPFVGDDINEITGQRHDVAWDLFIERVCSYRRYQDEG